jgi:hypothetical protein
VITNAAEGNQPIPKLSDRLYRLYRMQGHWLLVLIPLILILIRPLRWSWGIWFSYDSPLLFQPFLLLLAGILVWERRYDLLGINNEMTFLYSANSARMRGSLWLVSLSCIALIIAALAMVTPLAMLSFVGIVVGIIYYLYGMEIVKALWQPILLLLLTIPPPGNLLAFLSSFLQTITAKTVSATLRPFLGETHSIGSFILLPSAQFPIGGSLGGVSVVLPTLALTLWWVFRKRLQLPQTLLLLFLSLVISLFINGIRVFAVCLMLNRSPDMARMLAYIPSWALVIPSFLAIIFIARFLTTKPAVAFGEEEG